MDRACSDAICCANGLNFIRRVIPCIVSPVLDACTSDRVVVGNSIKTISAVRRLECDVHARFGDDDVKVVSSWMLHRNRNIAQSMSAFSNNNGAQGVLAV
jgi:hypothetical protein